ncbi:protein ORM1 [Purpureocillium lavendulum]|uniref:Protein ORM1 n=1 Tax=Purpureocillium lavendulum TaxID=1247861 RepID=A0AB34FWP4_9HYPO|nr:protein ORM1 [Purpureocillium lavendulum]
MGHDSASPIGAAALDGQQASNAAAKGVIHSAERATLAHVGQPESAQVQATIRDLSLTPHMEGGYFAVTDVSAMTMASPYPAENLSERTIALAGGLAPDYDPAVRRLSTTIFYYLTPSRPTGSFHRNRSRIIHTLHRGRGRYVLIHPDGHVETFVVGPNIDKGEKLQWVVEGGVWKASHLVGQGGKDVEEDHEGLLISETVVPGFEYADHEFLTHEKLAETLPENQAKELAWLVKH